MILLNIIKKLRLAAMLLFIIPSIALIGTLLFHNYLISFNFQKNIKINFDVSGDGKVNKILCSKENEFCKNMNFQKSQKLGECFKNKILVSFVTSDDKKINLKPGEQIKKINKKIYYKITEGNELNNSCIMNSNSGKLYIIFPFFFETIYKIKKSKKTVLGTNEVVNPFLYGETSISNIAKRHPVNYIFKTFLYMGVIVMLFYWIYFNKVLKILNQNNKNYLFLTFGILSAIFLFLHVLFLGWVFESELLTKLRRSYVVFFIFFEILAQGFLIRKIFLSKDKIKNYVNSFIIYLKIYFVLIIILITVSVILILSFYNLEPKVDYILEWNYFVFLLIFYFLSFLLWKKPNF